MWRANFRERWAGSVNWWNSFRRDLLSDFFVFFLWKPQDFPETFEKRGSKFFFYILEDLICQKYVHGTGSGFPLCHLLWVWCWSWYSVLQLDPLMNRVCLLEIKKPNGHANRKNKLTFGTIKIPLKILPISYRSKNK